MKFTEAQLEQAIIDLLKEEGHEHVYGKSIQRDLSDVLLKEDLKRFLIERYKTENLTSMEADLIIRQLENLPASDLYESNKTFMKLLSDGFAFKREDRSQKDIWIYLINFEQAASNTFKIVNQFEILGYHNRIPDGILFVNGLPLVVMEFKSAIKDHSRCLQAIDCALS